jgi:LacI family transcriptional regulator
MATIYEVSKLAGVSLATVSRVMNDSGRVSEKTRQKVLDAMAELDYQPNTIAQSLASNQSNCVGVLVSEMHGPIFGAMLSRIETELRGAGKFAIFAASHSDQEKEKEGIRFLAGRNCDALILHVEALPGEYFLDKRDSMLPFVLINRESEGLEHNCISLDNEQGGYLATRELLELGHRHIAYISGPLIWADASARLAGHRRALEEYGVAFDPLLLAEGNYHETGGSQATRRFLQLDTPITAIVCANDEMAAGAMEAIHSSGRSIPGDISVVGFDNVRWARFLYPKLTTVDFPVAEMSSMAAHWVLQNVYGVTGLKVQQRFTPSMVLRESIGPARVRKQYRA